MSRNKDVRWAEVNWTIQLIIYPFVVMFKRQNAMDYSNIRKFPAVKLATSPQTEYIYNFKSFKTFY